MKTPREIACQFKECLEAVLNEIPPDICGDIGTFRPEDYRTMAASVMIEFNKQGWSGNKSSGGGGRYTGPASDKQQALIAKLTFEKKNKGTEDVVQGFLDANDLKSCEELSKSQASSLIDTLAGLK